MYPTELPVPDPEALNAVYLAILGASVTHNPYRTGDPAMVATAFDRTEPKIMDLKLIRRALKNGWPVEPGKRASIVAFAKRAKATGRKDRIVQLADEVLNLFELIDQNTTATA